MLRLKGNSDCVVTSMTVEDWKELDELEDPQVFKYIGSRSRCVVKKCPECEEAIYASQSMNGYRYKIEHIFREGKIAPSQS